MDRFPPPRPLVAAAHQVNAIIKPTLEGAANEGQTEQINTSETEVQQLNNGSCSGAYREAAARRGKYVWSAQLGSSYKMGRDFGRDLSVQLEVVKDGANRSKIYAKFWHDGSISKDKSMAGIKAVAEGRK